MRPLGGGCRRVPGCPLTGGVPLSNERPHNPCREAVQARVVRQIRMLRAMRRGDYGDSYTGTQGETPDTAKEPPTTYRASSRPYQVCDKSDDDT